MEEWFLWELPNKCTYSQLSDSPCIHTTALSKWEYHLYTKHFDQIVRVYIYISKSNNMQTQLATLYPANKCSRLYR